MPAGPAGSPIAFPIAHHRFAVPPATNPAQASARITLALSLAGFSCFMLLYGTQPLLPQLTGAFAISPGTASLSVTAGTGLMALMLIPLSLLADRYGREQLMRLGLVGAAVFSLASAWAPDFTLLASNRLTAAEQDKLGVAAVELRQEAVKSLQKTIHSTVTGFVIDKEADYKTIKTAIKEAGY